MLPIKERLRRVLKRHSQKINSTGVVSSFISSGVYFYQAWHTKVKFFRLVFFGIAIADLGVGGIYTAAALTRNEVSGFTHTMLGLAISSAVGLKYVKIGLSYINPETIAVAVVGDPVLNEMLQNLQNLHPFRAVKIIQSLPESANVDWSLAEPVLDKALQKLKSGNLEEFEYDLLSMIDID